MGQSAVYLNEKTVIDKSKGVRIFGIVVGIYAIMACVASLLLLFINRQSVWGAGFDLINGIKSLDIKCFFYALTYLITAIYAVFFFFKALKKKTLKSANDFALVPIFIGAVCAVFTIAMLNEIMLVSGGGQTKPLSFKFSLATCLIFSIYLLAFVYNVVLLRGKANGYKNRAKPLVCMQVINVITCALTFAFVAKYFLPFNDFYYYTEYLNGVIFSIERTVSGIIAGDYSALISYGYALFINGLSVIAVVIAVKALFGAIVNLIMVKVDGDFLRSSNYLKRCSCAYSRVVAGVIPLAIQLIKLIIIVYTDTTGGKSLAQAGITFDYFALIGAVVIVTFACIHYALKRKDKKAIVQVERLESIIGEADDFNDLIKPIEQEVDDKQSDEQPLTNATEQQNNYGDAQVEQIQNDNVAGQQTVNNQAGQFQQNAYPYPPYPYPPYPYPTQPTAAQGENAQGQQAPYYPYPFFYPYPPYPNGMAQPQNPTVIYNMSYAPPQSAQCQPMYDAKICEHAVVANFGDAKLVIPKKTLEEKKGELSPDEKKWYKRIMDYAQSKEGAKRVTSTYNDSVVLGREPIVKMNIKQGKMICSFVFVSAEIKQLLGNSMVKGQSAVVKVVDEETFALALQSIDIVYQTILENRQAKHQEHLKKRREARAAKKQS